MKSVKELESKEAPLDLARGIYAPDRKLHGFVVKVVNKPGALANVLKVLAEANINVLGLSFSLLKPDEKVARIVLLTDCTHASMDIDHVVQNLRKTNDILKVGDFRQEPLGTLFDVFHFPLKVHEMRCVIFGEPVLIGMVEGLRKHVGSSINAILWHLGYYGGVEVAKVYEKEYGLTSPEEYFEMLKLRGIALGWFSITQFKIKKEAPKEPLRIFLRMTGSWECSLVGKKKKEPQSHFIRGILSGFSSYVFKREMQAEEVDCIATGSKYCEFVIKPNETVRCPY